MLPALFLLFVGSGCCRADLRDRLVPAAAAGHRVVVGVDRRAAGHVHGRHVPGQPAAAARRLAAAPSAARVRRARARHRRIRPACCCSACRSSAACTSRGAATASTGFLLRGVVAAVCLLPPTLAMGATLPAVSRWVETTPEGVSWLGLFYAGNIAGAVCRIAAGRFLPAARVRHGAWRPTSAVGLNVAGGARSPWRGARRRPRSRTSSLSREANCRRASAGSARRIGARPATVYLAIALSGFCALAGEVIWTRLLGLLFGATVYTFSLILAVFLIGLGIGSASGSALSKRSIREWRSAGASGSRRRHRVDGARARGVVAVLADQSRHLDQHLVQLPARFSACPVGGAAARHPLGRQLSARPRVGADRGHDPAGWSAACMRPIPSAPSPAR